MEKRLSPPKSPLDPALANARCLLNHLLQQDVGSLAEARTELAEFLPTVIASTFSRASAIVSLRNALTYPFAAGQLRMEILMALSEAIAREDILSEDAEGELADIYAEILTIEGSFDYEKGVAADRMGLLLKNSPYMPPQIARPIALNFMEKSLEYFDRTQYPRDWAAAHRNIGNLFRVGVTGQPTDVVFAISEFKLALEAIDDKTEPDLFATVSDNLATALALSPTGDKVENHYLALQHYSAALRLWSFTKSATDRIKASGNYLIIVARILDFAESGRDPSFESRKADLADSVRDVLETLDSYYERAQTQPFFEPTTVDFQIVERTASLASRIGIALQLTRAISRRVWLERALWLHDLLQREGIDLRAESRIVAALEQQKTHESQV